MLNPWFPKYSELRGFVKGLDGESEAGYRKMMNDIWAKIGNPRETVNWQHPDEWIPQRLEGKSREMAMKIWKVSAGAANPRYAEGSNWIIKRYKLLEDSSGVWRMSDRGREFLGPEPNQIVREIDITNGVGYLLNLVDVIGLAKRSELLTEWRELCRRTEPKVRAESTLRGLLYDRLVNLEERVLIVTEAGKKSITPKGKAYLESLQPFKGEDTTDRRLRKMIRENDVKVRSQLLDYLTAMDPYEFEGLVKSLLEAMGYEDVQAVGRAGDKGVDVIGTAQFGITEVKEVIQVKRKTNNIAHDVVVQLRGSLYTQKALRGTIVTLGGFTKAAIEASTPPNVAPISLINGEKLLDLLIESGIGIQKHDLSYITLDTESLKPVEAAEAGEQPDKT